MSSQSGVTEMQVFEIADQLLAIGQAPTLKSIRNDLKTGSFTTIANHLAKWKKMRLEQSPTPQPPLEFQTSTLRIWHTAYREAEKVFANERDAFEAERGKWEEEKKEFLSIIKKQEEELEGQFAREGEVKNQLHQLNKELRIAHEALARVTTQLETTELRRLEILERADRLESKLTGFLNSIDLKERGMKSTFSSADSGESYQGKDKKISNLLPTNDGMVLMSRQ